MSIPTRILLRGVLLSLAAALSCPAADSPTDDHVSRTESDLARSLSGFFSALGGSLEEARRQEDGDARDSSRGGSGGTVTVDIRGEHGWIPIHLERRGSGFVGPRGEYYSRLPEASELERRYGSAPPSHSGWHGGGSSSWSGSANNEWSGTTVLRGTGEVTVRVPGRAPMKLRTEFPIVRRCKVIDRDGSVSVESQARGGDPVVQNFSLQDGRQRHRIPARDIRNGQPEWASAFEPDSRPSWGSGNPGGSGNAWAGVTVRRGSGEVTVNVPGRAPMRLRTAGSQVRQWRVVQSDGSVTVSSQQSGMDEVLQNFSLGDGRERHRMNLRDLKGGGAQPEWARGF